MRPTEWKTIGTSTATTCGHRYSIQEATNDRGERVTRHDAYPDPDAYQFEYDAPQLCHECYTAAMERRPMTFTQLVDVFLGH